MYTVKTKVQTEFERMERLNISQKFKLQRQNYAIRMGSRRTREDILQYHRKYREELPDLRRIKMAERDYHYTIKYKLQKAEMKARWQSNRVQAVIRLDDRYVFLL